MRSLVLDASVLLKWFRPGREPDHAAAARLRAEYVAGELEIAVPALLFTEVINVAGRSWQLGAEALQVLAAELQLLGLRVEDPPLESVAAWTARGLTAYDATYVALAESERAPLITGDAAILRLASGVACAPASR